MSESKSEFVRFAVLLLSVSVILSSGSPVMAQDSKDTSEIVVDGTLHELPELYRLLERSEITYTIHDGSDSADELYEPNRTVLTPGIHISFDSLGIPQYTYVALDTSRDEQFKKAEKAFNDEDYRFAIDLYQELFEIAPAFDYLLAYIGDAYMELKEFDSSKVYYEKAIENNSIDYQRRWFYADLLWRMGDSAKAINQITIAHILNVYHEKVFDRLVQLRERVGRPWKDWSVLPRAYIAPNEKKVDIVIDTDWIGYGITKALWLYEPDYALRMYGHPREQEMMPIKEEREALAATMRNNESLYALVFDTVGTENFDLFILYEIIAKRNPYKMLPLAPESMEDLVEYLDKFH